MEKYLTVEDVSTLLQVPKSWIYEKTRLNLIPFKKIGKYLRFNKSEIENWVNRNHSSLYETARRKL